MGSSNTIPSWAGYLALFLVALSAFDMYFGPLHPEFTYYTSGIETIGLAIMAYFGFHNNGGGSSAPS